MAASIRATIAYAGSILIDQITTSSTTSPWQLYNAIYPEYGGVPFLPQFETDVLQPRNVDGARYRIGGAHFPAFRLISIATASDYDAAQLVAREMELCKGDRVLLVPNADSSSPVTRTCTVIDVRAIASSRYILGASTDVMPGVPAGSGSRASIDTEWKLQVVAK